MSGTLAILMFCSLGQQPLPKGPQPRFAIVHEFDKDKGEIMLLQVETVPEIVTVKSVENGLEVIRKEIRQVSRTVPMQFSFDKGTVIDAASKKVLAADVWKRLKRGATVLVVSGQVDPLYLRIVQPDTLIFITSPLSKFPQPKV